MFYTIVRKQAEIDELLDDCAEAEADGKTKFSGMTYEQGITEAIRWLTEKDAEHPLAD